jgi:1-acyl-sn-glycerol-3-phosphate acyltransferase
VVAAPHTSNWDYFYTLAAGLVWGVPFSFLAKESLFRGPFGWLMRVLGGVPVDRTRLNNLLPWAIEQFEQRERFVLVIPPEGTRRRTEVPIALGYVDYARRVTGVGPSLVPSGDVEADMAVIAAFYAGVVAKFPEQVGPVRFAARRRAEGRS